MRCQRWETVSSAISLPLFMNLYTFSIFIYILAHPNSCHSQKFSHDLLIEVLRVCLQPAIECYPIQSHRSLNTVDDHNRIFIPTCNSESRDKATINSESFYHEQYCRISPLYSLKINDFSAGAKKILIAVVES